MFPEGQEQVRPLERELEFLQLKKILGTIRSCADPKEKANQQ